MRHRLSIEVLFLALLFPSYPLFATPQAVPSVESFLSRIPEKGLDSKGQEVLKQALAWMSKNDPQDFAALNQAIHAGKSRDELVAQVVRLAGEYLPYKDVKENADLLLAKLRSISHAVQLSRGSQGSKISEEAADSIFRSDLQVSNFIWKLQDKIDSAAGKGESPRDLKIRVAQILEAVKNPKTGGSKAYSGITSQLINGGPKSFADFLAGTRSKSVEEAASSLVEAWKKSNPTVPSNAPAVVAAPADSGFVMTSLRQSAPPEVVAAASPELTGKDSGTKECKANPDQAHCKIAGSIVRNRACDPNSPDCPIGNIANRLMVFLWTRDGAQDGKSFILKNRQTEPERKGAEFLVTEWVKWEPENAANLYFALEGSRPGTQPIPAWFKSYYAEFQGRVASGKLPSDIAGQILAELDSKFARANAGYYTTTNSKGSGDQGDAAGVGGNAYDWIVNQFFRRATELAVCYLYDAKCVKSPGAEPIAEEDKDKKKKEEKADLDKGQNALKRALLNGAIGMIPGVGDYFGYWGDTDVLCLHAKGDFDHCRFISVRLVTVREKEELKEKIAVVDFTQPHDDRFNPNPPPAKIKLFDVGTKGPQDIKWFFDVPANDPKDPNKTKSEPEIMTFEIEYGRVVVRWPDGTEGVNAMDMAKQQKGDVTDGLKFAELHDLRLEHAKSRNQITAIGGKMFYVLPESNGRACYSFVPVSDEGGKNNELLGCTASVSGNTTQQETKDQELGKVGETHYNLTWRQYSGSACTGVRCGYWEAVEGPAPEEERNKGKEEENTTKDDNKQDTASTEASKKKSEGKEAGDKAAEASGKINECGDRIYQALQGQIGNGVYKSKIKSESKDWCTVEITLSGGANTNQFLLIVMKDRAIYFSGVLLCLDTNKCVQEIGDNIYVRSAVVDPVGRHITQINWKDADGAHVPLKNGDDSSDIFLKEVTLYEIPKKAIRKIPEGAWAIAEQVASMSQKENHELTSDGRTRPSSFTLYLKDVAKKSDLAERKARLKKLFDEYDANSQQSPIFKEQANRDLVESFVEEQLGKDKENDRTKVDEKKEPVWDPRLYVDLFTPPTNGSKVWQPLVSYHDKIASHDEELHKANLVFKEGADGKMHLEKDENPRLTSAPK